MARFRFPTRGSSYDRKLRADDQDQGSRTGHEDIEVLTAAYHAGHLRAKAQAGFRNYASAADRSCSPRRSKTNTT